jgi:hypothetical protein
MATQESDYKEFVPPTLSVTGKTFGELSKEQYKTIMTQVLAAEQKLLPPSLYPPGTLIQGAPLNQPAPAPGSFHPPAFPISPLSFGYQSFVGAQFGAPSFTTPSFNPASNAPASIGSAAPASAAPQTAH